MEIVKYPNPILNRIADEISLFDRETLNKLNEMRKYVLSNKNALGLAMPQIGISQRGFVMKISRKSVEIVINPIICRRSSELTEAKEGCLSLDDVTVFVKRYAWIDVMYIDHNRKVNKVHFSGLMARIFQHEFDHLNGALIIDH